MCCYLHALRVWLAAYTPAARARANDYWLRRNQRFWLAPKLRFRPYGVRACEGQGTPNRLLDHG